MYKELLTHTIVILVNMQKQNPFLKPTPLFSNSYASSSYSAYPPVSKYSSYTSFEVPKPMLNYDSYSNNIERLPEAAQPSKFKSSTDINDILKNNPFNRPPPSIFSGSSATSHSPAKYEATKTYQHYPPTSYQRPTLDLYSKPRTNYSMNDKLSYPQQPNKHTPKKYDNYLSTSSADSATTYINRIYDIQEEKLQGTSNLSNPFLRKNLIQDRIYDKQVKNTPNSYDHAALKYIASHKQKPYMENNYFASSNQPKKTNNYELNNYKASQEYEQPLPNPYKSYKNDTNAHDNSYKAGKYDKYDANIDKYDSKYNKYEVTTDKYENQYQNKFNNYDKYQSKKDYKDKPLTKKDVYQPSKYQEYTSPQYDSGNSKFNFDQEDPYVKPKISEVKDQFDYSDKYNSKRYEQQLKREKFQETQRRERFEDSIQPTNKYQSYDHKYSFKPEYNPKEQSKKSIQRIPQFGQSKNKVKEYSAADYETLGGRKESYKPKQQVYVPAGGSKKLISSQVQQYSTNPYQKAQNTNPYKAQLAYKPYEQTYQTRQKFTAYDQEEEPRMKSKGAVRDQDQGFPKMLQYNGMVFYRIQVK